MGSNTVIILLIYNTSLKTESGILCEEKTKFIPTGPLAQKYNHTKIYITKRGKSLSKRENSWKENKKKTKTLLN